MGFEHWFNKNLNRVWGFIEQRAGISKWALRPQPAFTFKPSYWTGAFVANAFFIQVATGLLLLLYYEPSVAPTLTSCGQPLGTYSTAPAAWCSTYYLIHGVPMGSLLLSSHLYGAYAMLFLAFIHFYRGYYLGAYKKPREFSWMAGTPPWSVLKCPFTGTAVDSPTAQMLSSPPAEGSFQSSSTWGSG